MAPNLRSRQGIGPSLLLYQPSPPSFSHVLELPLHSCSSPSHPYVRGRLYAMSCDVSASRAVKRRKKQKPEPQNESVSGPKEVGTRYPPSSKVRIRKTIDLKEGSFVKKQRFVNGELVEETVEEVDRDEAKAALKI